MTKRFNGRLIKVFERKQRLPNGQIVNLEIVKHPGAVLIIPFLNKRKIVFIKQYRPVVGIYIYELPAGTLRKGESHINCAQRGLKEEIGYSAKKLFKIGEIFPAPGYTTEKILVYKAENLKKKKDIFPEKDEIITSDIFTQRKTRQLFESSKIVDAKTICALAMCGWL